MNIKLTERQEKILDVIVREYVDSAQPVSSQLLERKYDFDICPATIRIEMQELTDKGLLYQPHTSAGRIPTDKGYRFFVDDLLEKEPSFFEMGDWFEKEIVEDIKFIQSLTKNLAHFSGVLALSYFEKEKIFWKEGWEEILKEPEFREEKCIINFTKLLENFEKNIEDLELNSGIKIYIGKENPFKNTRDFSIIASKCYLPDAEDYNPPTTSSRLPSGKQAPAIISLLGPKRMDYNRNISLINSLAELMGKM